MFLGRHDACDVPTTVEPFSLVRVNCDGRLEEGKRIDGTSLKEGGLDDQQNEQAATDRRNGHGLPSKIAVILSTWNRQHIALLVGA